MKRMKYLTESAVMNYSTPKATGTANAMAAVNSKEA